MKKKLLAIFLPVVIAIAGSLAVWANEPSATQPGCDKCAKAKSDQSAAVGEKGAPAVKAAAECDKCPKMKGAEGKPCGEKGCDKSAKLQPTDTKPCCDKGKKE